ncbi:MAG: TraR/DksA C4-type zinc finger protein [Planctomycetota bacterium]|nr:TraR/DksA C4-type zinc finger protein [Planctomycetota bacterium]
MKRLSAKELEEHAARLRTMLTLLSGDIDRLEEEAIGEAGIQIDASGEGGTDSYSQEFSLELIQRDESTVREVLDALDRVKNGSFGFCELCQVAIGKERLKHMPHARNCIACQRKEEEGRA